MAFCSRCGREFDLSSARRAMGIKYGSGSYNEYYPDGDVCEECAGSEMGADFAAGAEILDLMGDSWDDD